MQQPVCILDVRVVSIRSSDTTFLRYAGEQRVGIGSRKVPDQSYKMIPAKQAFEMLEGNPSAVLIDVRSDMEYLMVGHPAHAVHIAWIDAPDWTVNPGFVAEVRKVLLGRAAAHEKNAPVVLLCRSANRSQDAADVLIAQGFENVYVVEGGFEGPLDENHHRSKISGWRYEGLPWEQC